MAAARRPRRRVRHTGRVNADVDHLVLAVTDLSAAAVRIKDLLGVAATGGGRHIGAGTTNLIVPLGTSYLEFVTVTDAAEADRDAFGQLIATALRDGRLFAGWVCAIDQIPPAHVSHRLERAGVDVDLLGLAGALAEPSRPFLLYRPTHTRQRFPGELDGAGDGWELAALRVTGPTTPEPRLGLNTPSGSTRIELVPSDGGPQVVAAELVAGDGRIVALDRGSWSRV